MIAVDPEELAGEPVRFWVAPKVAHCAQVARAGCPDDSHQAFRHSAGSAPASAHSAAADLGQDDCLAELMVDDPPEVDADSGAPIPDDCPEQERSLLDDSAGLTVDDRYAPGD